VNRDELNWLLQTIKDAEIAERFVLAQYERGRISAEMRADVARECAWIDHTTNQCQLLRCVTQPNTRRRNYQLQLRERSSRMSAQSLENHNRRGTGEPAKRRTFAREEYASLAAAKRGDSAAFEILCKQAANTVFHVARRMMRNNEDAEDVVQESFQQAFIHLNSFNGDSRFSTWLSRIAINAALMKLRKKNRLRDVSLDESAETEESSSRIDVEDLGLNPEQLYAQKEQQRILSEAMKALTPGMRKAIELRELDERSTEEAARIMGISVGAVKARVFHGRRKLRERLNHVVGPAWASARSARTIGNTRRIPQDRLACHLCG
jgi:RNA polymerase sigma-70 factor (ECF subfamily)